MTRIFEGFDGATAPARRYSLSMLKIYRRRELNPETKRRLILILQSGRSRDRAAVVARCPLCTKMLGVPDRTLGDYVWLEGSDHYVEAHNLVTPKLFELLESLTPP